MLLLCPPPSPYVSCCHISTFVLVRVVESSLHWLWDLPKISQQGCPCCDCHVYSLHPCQALHPLARPIWIQRPLYSGQILFLHEGYVTEGLSWLGCLWLLRYLIMLRLDMSLVSYFQSKFKHGLPQFFFLNWGNYLNK